MPEDEETGSSIRSQTDSPDETTSLLLGQASFLRIDQLPERHKICVISSSGLTLSSALVETCLALIERQDSAWHTTYLASCAVWFSVGTISVVLLCVIQPLLIRRLPITVTFCVLCATALYNFLDLNDIVIFAPLISTILAAITLFTPSENLITLSRFWFGEDVGERVKQYLQHI